MWSLLSKNEEDKRNNAEDKRKKEQLNVWVHDLANVKLILNLGKISESMESELIRIINEMKSEAEKL